MIRFSFSLGLFCFASLCFFVFLFSSSVSSVFYGHCASSVFVVQMLRFLTSFCGRTSPRVAAVAVALVARRRVHGKTGEKM